MSNEAEAPVPIVIDKDAVNKYVADAILKSALGAALEKSIERVMDQVRTDYRNPLDGVIMMHIQEQVKGILVRDYSEKIRDRVHKALENKLTDEFIGRIVEAAANKYT